MTELTNPIKIVVIGIMELNDGEKEIRFRLDDEGNWCPDLLVDHRNDTVGPPPPCFTPRQEVIDKLNASFVEQMQQVFDWLETIT